MLLDLPEDFVLELGFDPPAPIPAAEIFEITIAACFATRAACVCGAKTSSGVSVTVG